MELLLCLSLALLAVVPGFEAQSNDGPSSRGAIRLVQNGFTSTSYTSGVVQVWWNRQWGNICDDDGLFGLNEANVICHQLSWSGASSYTTSQFDDYDDDTSSTALRSLSCSNSEYVNIFQCSYSIGSIFFCNNNNDVSVTCHSTRIWDDPYDGQIRLQGGEYSNQGLVEVYCNGEWGTICNDSFGFREARVICRQLGYNDYYNYDHLLITGDSSQSIWLDSLFCSSTHNCIGSCERCPTSEYHNCFHSEDVTIECDIDTSLSDPTTDTSTCDEVGAATDVDGPSSNGAIRLVQNGFTSTSYTSGVVQVWWNGQWGNICDDGSFGYAEANVICHHLGWSGYSSYTTSQYDDYDTDNSSTAMYGLSCSNSEYVNIFQCSYSTSYFSFCNDNTDVSVTCYSTRIWDNPYDGQIRLRGGEYSNQGLVEVYCNGEWGTICDSHGFSQARVICHQLGYNDYYRYDHLTSLTGDSSQSIWLNDVYCSSSTYNCIGSCERCPTSEYRYCYYSEHFIIECDIDTFSSDPTTDTSTCDGVGDPTGDPIDTSTAVEAIVGGIVGGIICLIIVCAVPICICVCIGCGACGSSSRRPRTVVATGATTTAVVSTTGQQSYPLQPITQQQGYTYPQQNQKAPSNPPPPAYGDIPQQQAYPPQQQQQGYESPPQYPTDFGLPPQGIRTEEPPPYDLVVN